MLQLLIGGGLVWWWLTQRGRKPKGEPAPTPHTPSPTPSAPTPSAPPSPVPTPSSAAVPKVPISEMINPSADVCTVDGLPYDEGWFTSPGIVKSTLISLGFTPDGTEPGGVVMDQPLPYETNKTSVLPSEQPWLGGIKRFQARAISLGLPGFVRPGGSPVGPSKIDGIVGPCTLRALDAARIMKGRGDW